MIAIRVGGQSLDLDLDSAIKINNKLSVQYKTESSPEKRREIIGILYQLNLPLFKKWHIYNFEEKADYSQEVFFWVSRALEKFDPARGAFLHFLKQYFVRESQRQFLTGQTRVRNVQDAVAMAPEPEIRNAADSDHLFWDEAKKLLGEEDWILVHGCLFEGQTPTDMARKQGRPVRTVTYHYSRALESLRVHVAKRSLRKSVESDGSPEGDWLGRKKLCQVLGITPRYLNDWSNPNRPWSVCPTYIDPRDILPLQGGRFRYLFTAKDGLVYPRSIPRKK